MAGANLKIAAVVINWNNKEFIAQAINSLLSQTYPCSVIVIDNGSTDGSLKILKKLESEAKITVIRHSKNQGFTGGANAGIRFALKNGFDAVALLNSDAIAEPEWLEYLTSRLNANPKTGITTGKLLNADGTQFDSTGDYLSIWGLPFPRGRGQRIGPEFDTKTRVLGASGGASLYRCKTLAETGLFDNDFFAYYEDVDLSLRVRLLGWEVVFEPKAIARHQIGGTSSKIKGFTTYQTMKNLPMLVLKNVFGPLFWKMLPRFLLAYCMFFGRALTSGRGWMAVKGWAAGLVLLPKKLGERRRLQKRRKITWQELDSLLLHDLPPNAKNLRKLRSAWWRIRGKK